MPRAASATAASKAPATRVAAASHLWYEGAMKKAIAISHVCFEDAGTLEDALDARGVPLRTLQAGVDDLSEAKDADILVLLGGPIGVYELDRYPFLRAEFAVIEAALARGKPIVGICLGAQLIAAALGARVYPAREKEIGWGLIGLTPDGRKSPLVALNDNKCRVLHWHGDTFDLPRGTTWLAETAIAPYQAFSANKGKVLALQFHIEPHAARIERWLIGHTLELTTSGIDVHKLRADTQRLGPGLEKVSRKLFDDWLDQVGVTAPRATAPAD
jgi:GMP synthase (glutamine-hydrolysing)